MEKKKKNLIDALRKTMGIVSSACESVKIHRSTYYEWLKSDPEFAQAVEEVNDRQIDLVESKLLERIKDGDTTATIYYLKTKGRNRGYSEKLEINARISPFEQLMMDVEDED